MTRNVFLLLLCFVLPPVIGAEEPPPVDSESAELTDESSMSIWMEKKLEYSRSLLKHLAMADFEELRSDAEKLKLLNRVEGFVRRRNPDYRDHVRTFNRVTAEIVRQAEQENIEGATLAFNQLTVCCVECHKSLRSDAAQPSRSKPATK
jgi:hypothetical protein